MNSKNEIGVFFNKYVAKYIDADDVVLTNCSGSTQYNSVANLMNAMKECIDFDRPDGYMFNAEKSTLYIFEHFEFDCSENKEHQGSKLRYNINKVNREVKREIDCADKVYSSEKIIEQGVGVERDGDTVYEIDTNSDEFRNNYVRNFKTAFEPHSLKLQDYIEHCIQEIKVTPSNIISIFLIEDKTLGGTHYIRGRDFEPVNLIFTKQFVETFKKSKIDYVFFAMPQYIDLAIYDKSMLNDSSIKYVDLLKEKIFAASVMLKITSCIKTTK